MQGNIWGNVWVQVAAATLALVAALVLLAFAFRRLYRFLDRLAERERPLLAVQQWEVLRPADFAAVCLRVARVGRLVVTLLALDLHGSWVFARFGAGELWSRSLLSYLADPALGLWRAFVAWLPDLFSILTTGIVLYLGLLVIRALFRSVERGVLTIPGFHTDWARPTYRIVRTLLLVVAAIGIFPHLPGADSQFFGGISVFVGALITLGSSGAISNIMAGLVLIYTRAFQLGETVRIGDDIGTVTDKNMLVTRLRTAANEEITIPNGVVLGRAVKNYSVFPPQQGLVLEIPLHVAYEVDWRRVHELLLAAATRTPAVLDAPPPFVEQADLDRETVRYALKAYTRDVSRMPAVRSDLNRNVLDVFREAGVEIAPPPVHVVRTESPNLPPPG